MDAGTKTHNPNRQGGDKMVIDIPVPLKNRAKLVCAMSSVRKVG